MRIIPELRIHIESVRSMKETTFKVKIIRHVNFRGLHTLAPDFLSHLFQIIIRISEISLENVDLVEL